MRLGLLVNPTAGRGRAGRSQVEIENALGAAGHDITVLTAANYEAALAAAKQSIEHKSIDGLVVVGGDGMAHLGTNACAGTDVPLGVLPYGTGNDSARALGMPLNTSVIDHLIKRIATPRAIDVLQVRSSIGQFYSLGSVSVGFDALVNQRANRMKFPKGPSRYPVAMIAELANFKPIYYRVTIDGSKHSLDAMLCAVANAPSYGGGMLVAPDAQIDDGLLDLFVVRAISRPELIRIFPSVYKGGHVTHPAVELIRAESVHIEAYQMPAFADGEAVGHAPISVTVKPGFMKVFA